VPVKAWGAIPDEEPPPRVEAEFHSECPECGYDIDPGDEITKDPRWHGDTWIHHECKEE
jgi:hypothetical protein